jgi:hypothetical protein
VAAFLLECKDTRDFGRPMSSSMMVARNAAVVTNGNSLQEQAGCRCLVRRRKPPLPRITSELEPPCPGGTSRTAPPLLPLNKRAAAVKSRKTAPHMENHPLPVFPRTNRDLSAEQGNRPTFVLGRVRHRAVLSSAEFGLRRRASSASDNAQPTSDNAPTHLIGIFRIS